ncbi:MULTISPECIES: EpsG family protein [unclassified Providencia]|uniref:EpsG family protein n=1 Tax=unclassified Providencia TaxID=2633465 RepID=UPI003FA6BC79
MVVFLNKDKIYFTYYILICALISLFFSFREFNTTVSWVQNDTNNYYLYYVCLRDNTLSICNSIIGLNIFEITLPSIGMLSDVFGGGHYLMFFSTSIIFFSALFFFYKSLGIYSILIVPLVLLSPSFWEFQLNIIRNSLACSFFLISISYSFYFKKTKSFLLIPTLLSHTSGLLYFASERLSKLINVKVLLVFFVLALSINLSEIFINILSYVPYLNSTTIIRKLIAYSSLTDTNISIVSIVGKVYLFVTFMLFFILRDNNESHALAIYKILLFILIIGCLLQGTSVMYRVINIYIFIIFYLVVFGVKENKRISYFLYSLCLLWVCFDFHNNYVFYTRFIQ